MFCGNCGAKMGDGMKFCAMCGSPLVSEDAPVPEAAPAENDAPTMIFTPSADAAPADASAPETAPWQEPVQPDYQPQQMPQYAPPVQQEQPQMQQFTPPQPRTPRELAPTEAQFAPASYKATPIKKKSVAKIILFSILFGILILIFGTAAAGTGFARSILAGNKLSGAVAESALSEIVVGDIICDDAFADFLVDQLEANGVNEAVAGFSREGYDLFVREFVDEDTTIGELVAVAVNEDEFSAKDTERLITSAGLTRAIADVIAAYEEHLLTGEDVSCTSVSKIMKIIEKGHEELEELADTRYNVDMDIIEEVLEDNEDVLDDIAPQNTLAGVGKYTSLALSPVTVIVLAVLAVLFAALIAVTSKSVSASFVTFGICSVLIGGGFIVVTFLEKTIMNIIGLEYEAITTFTMGLVDKAIFSEFFRYGVIIAGAGAACIVIGIIISVIASAVAKKKARNS